MINPTKLVLIGTFFAATAVSAFGSPLTGTIDITGTAKSGGGGVINFTTNPTASSNGTGSFQYFDGTKEVVFSSTFSIASITPTTGEMLFSMTKGGYTLDFYVTGYSIAGSTYTFTGYLTENGVWNSEATLTEIIKGSAGGNLGNDYTADLSLTPEPPASILLATGLLAVGAIVSRRRGFSLTRASSVTTA